MAITISKKLIKIDEDVTVSFADNGFIVSATGRDANDDWANAKILCNTLEEVSELLGEAASMERS